jgi:hypothetical protein
MIIVVLEPTTAKLDLVPAESEEHVLMGRVALSMAIAVPVMNSADQLLLVRRHHPRPRVHVPINGISVLGTVGLERNVVMRHGFALIIVSGFPNVSEAVRKK